MNLWCMCRSCRAVFEEPEDPSIHSSDGGAIEVYQEQSDAEAARIRRKGELFEEGRQRVLASVAPTGPVPTEPMNPAAHSPTSLTYAEAAQRLGCGVKTVRRLVSGGTLKKALGPGRKARVTIVSVEALEAPRPAPVRKAASTTRPTATPVTPGAVVELFGRPSRKSKSPAT
jgi:excisionase family DNA binding protein